MPRITETATIGMDPETLWNEIGEFGSVGDWHPMLESTETRGQGQGAVRIAHAKAGGDQVERLQTLDPERHLYRYTMESSPMPVRDYSGEFRIDAAGSAASTVVWSARFELTPDGDGKTIEAVRQFLHAGTVGLLRRFGESPA